MKKRKFTRTGTFYVYILLCQDGTYYTGHTNDLERRLKQHNSGKGAWYTRVKGPGSMVWRKEYRCFKPAFLMEKRIKTLTRLQKEALVKGMRLDRVLAEAKKRRPGVCIPGKFHKNLPGTPRTRPLCGREKERII